MHTLFLSLIMIHVPLSLKPLATDNKSQPLRVYVLAYFRALSRISMLAYSSQTAMQHRPDTFCHTHIAISKKHGECEHPNVPVHEATADMASHTILKHAFIACCQDFQSSSHIIIRLMQSLSDTRRIKSKSLHLSRKLIVDCKETVSVWGLA